MSARKTPGKAGARLTSTAEARVQYASEWVLAAETDLGEALQHLGEDDPDVHELRAAVTKAWLHVRLAKDHLIVSETESEVAS